jgi:hypothetical protein
MVDIRGATWLGGSAHTLRAPEQPRSADRRREHPRRPPDRRQLAGTIGLDIAIWRPEGSCWVRPDTAGTLLANTP